MMRRFLVLLSLLIFVSPPAEWANCDQPKKTADAKLTPLMRMKLERSKDILEGLTIENFDKIQKNAQYLKLLSLESGWNVIQTEEYMDQSRNFRETCNLIIEAATEKDTNRATLGYVTMTIRCVECHAYMRKHREQLSNLEQR